MLTPTYMVYYRLLTVGIAGVLGFVSSEPFTGIGSDYLFDAL